MTSDSGRPSDARREARKQAAVKALLHFARSVLTLEDVPSGKIVDVVLDAADAVSDPTPRPTTRTEDGLIADAYQLIDWWLNARDKHVENHDALARKWIAWANDWLDVKSHAAAPEPLTPPRDAL